MQRGKKAISPTYILTADWHLRLDKPICRTDDFVTEQWESVQFVSDLQRKYNCPVLHGGDLFHHWKPTPELLTLTMKHLPNQFMTCYGNHDLPQHSMNLVHKCGIYTLETSGHLTTKNSDKVEIVHFNGEPSTDKVILLWHIMTYQGKKLWPGQTDPKATKLLIQNPSYSLIVTGDNHHSFVEEYEDRFLVNPGSLTRQTASQIDFKPSVYLYYEKSNKIKRVFIPIQEDVISREHIEITKQRNEKIEAFISALEKDWDADFDFEKNLKRFQQANNIEKDVMDIIYESIK